jgi:hypothetical protein
MQGCKIRPPEFALVMYLGNRVGSLASQITSPAKIQTRAVETADLASRLTQLEQAQKK